MSCTHSADCPLFAQFAMEPSLAIWKQHYCDGEFTKCARFQLGLKGEAVPITLMPNGKMIAAKSKTTEELAGTALFNAILKGRTIMVKSLFASNIATGEVTTSDGSTPLMAAASVGSLDIVNLLLDLGCNPYNKNDKGLNALAIAQNKNFTDCANVINKFMDTHLDLQNKVSVTTADGTTAATAAEEEKEIKGIMGLLRNLNPFSK